MTRIRLWLRIQFRQAVRNRSVYVSLAICLAILIMVVPILSGIQTADRIQKHHTFGFQHGFLTRIDHALVDELRGDSRVESLGIITLTGIVGNPMSELSLEIGLGSYDETARQLSGMELKEGRWPQNENEIAIEEVAMLSMRLDAGIGDRIDLTLTGVQHEEIPGDPAPFVLVGILKNFTYMQYHPAPEGQSLPALPGVVSMPEAGAPTGIRMASIRLDESVPYVPFFQELSDRQGMDLDRYYLNTAAYEPDGELDPYQTNVSSHFPEGELAIGYSNTVDASQQLIQLAIFFLIGLVLLLVLTTLLIFRRKQESTLFRLRLAGFSPGQIVLSGAGQAGMSLLLLAPVGTGMGILLAIAVSRLVIRDWIPHYELILKVEPIGWILLAFAIVITAALAVLSVTSIRRRPLETGKEMAEKDNEPGKTVPGQERKSGKRADWHEKRPILLWALRSFSENRLALAGVLFTLALCFASMLVSSYLIAMMRQENRYNPKHDVVLSLNSTGISTNLNIPVLQKRFENKDLRSLLAIDEIRSVDPTTHFHINMVDSQEPDRIALVSSLGFTDTEASIRLDPAVTANQKAQYGYGKDERVFTGRVVGAEAVTLDRLRPYLIEGEIDVDALMSGEEILIVTQDQNRIAAVGDELTLTQIVDPDGSTQETSAYLGDPITLDWDRQDVQVRIGAIAFLGDNVAEVPFHPHGEQPVVVWGTAAFGHFGLSDLVSTVFINMVDYRDDDLLREEIARLDTLYPGMQVQLRSESERQIEAENNTIVGIAYGILSLLAFFAVFSMYSFSQSLAERNRRVVGALRAGGLSLGKMRHLKLLESVFQLLLSFAFANVLGFGFAFVFRRPMPMEHIGSQFADILQNYPIGPVAVALPLFLGILFVCQMLPIRRLYAVPVCDLIRET